MSDGLPEGRPLPRGWQIAVGVVVAVLLVVGVGLLIARAAGFAEVRDAIDKADSTWFAVCLAAQVLALAAYAEVVRGAFRWRGGPDPGFRLSGEVMLASIGARPLAEGRRGTKDGARSMAPLYARTRLNRRRVRARSSCGRGVFSPRCGVCR